jgi:hypothetical protein
MSNPVFFAYTDEKKTPDLTVNSEGIIPSALVIDPELFAYRQLPTSLYLQDTSGLQNMVTLSPKYFNGDIDNIECFVYIPIINPSFMLCPDPNLNSWGWNIINMTNKNAPGVFSSYTALNVTSGPTISPAGTTGFSASTNITLPNDNTQVGLALILLPDLSFLDDFLLSNGKYDFDNIYLGINSSFQINTNQEQNQDSELSPMERFFVVKTRPFFGPASENNMSINIDTNFIATKNAGSGSFPYQGILVINNLPDDYYSTNPNTNNVYFLTNISGQYGKSDGSGGGGAGFLPINGQNGSLPNPQALLCGYTNMQLSADPRTLKAALAQIMFFLGFQGAVMQGYQVQFEAEIKDLAWILSKSVSIKESLFSGLQGRTFGGPPGTFDGNNGSAADCWSNRRLTTNMINDPLDMLESIKRCQNWSEIAVPSLTVGKQYDGNALIKRGFGSNNDGAFDGSFDNPSFGGYSTVSPNPNASFGQIRHCRPAFQLFDDSKMWTDAFGRALCKTFGILSYIDANGVECVESFAPYGTSNLKTITFSDLADKAGDIVEPEIQDVFCEPSIEYGYDSGADKFQQFLAVTNTNASVNVGSTGTPWIPAYTPGFDNTTIPGNFTIGGYDPFKFYSINGGPWTTNEPDGHYIWSYCHHLYLKYGQVEKCPSDFSEQPLISIYADALYSLTYRLLLMQYQRISLSVYYDKGSSWHPFQHLSVTLPVWGNTAIECVIETIQKDKNNDRVKIDLILLNII